MSCIFTWSNLESAERYRLQYVPGSIIHRCRVIEGSGIVLDGGLLPPGMNLADLSPGSLADEITAAQARAEKYWNAHPSSEFPELLITGSVEVLDLMSNR